MTQDTQPGPGDLAPGEQLAGYEIQQRIGRGGMAVVYRALDLRLGRLVALKVLAPHLGEDEAFRQRFMRESRAAAGVDHPHIIPVFEAGEAGGVLFIAMRYVAGGDVRSLIEAEGRLSPGRTARIVSQVASALDAAHAHGLIHRDVKPANILLGQASGSDADHAYLSDFGLSKHAVSTSTLTSTGQFLGTLDYVSPEQIQGHPIDGRADEYGLACAVVEMLTGAPPFRRDDSMALMWAQLEATPPRLTERRPDLSRAVDDVIAAAMSKTPAGRFGTCRDFAAALAAACDYRLPQRSGPQAGLPGSRAESAPTDPFRADPVPPNAQAAQPFAADGLGGDRFAADRFAADRFAARPNSATQADLFPTAGLATEPDAQTTQDPWPQDLGDWFRGGDSARAPEHAADPDRQGGGRGDGPVPVPVESFRQPSVHAAWPAATTSTRHNGAPPTTHPQQAGRGPAGRGRPGQHRARNVVVGLLIAIVGLCGVAGIAYKLSHRPARALPPVTVYKTVPPGGGAQDPAATVRQYFAAINHRRYLEAWRLSGQREPFLKFQAGYAGTLRDTVTILGVSGDVVTARLAAMQTDGTLKTYKGTYTVSKGIIIATNVIRTS